MKKLKKILVDVNFAEDTENVLLVICYNVATFFIPCNWYKLEEDTLTVNFDSVIEKYFFSNPWHNQGSQREKSTPFFPKGVLWKTQWKIVNKFMTKKRTLTTVATTKASMRGVL